MYLHAMMFHDFLNDKFLKNDDLLPDRNNCSTGISNRFSIKYLTMLSTVVNFTFLSKKICFILGLETELVSEIINN